MYLYGASGHAKVVIDILRDQGITVEALIDDDPTVDSLAGIEVRHDPSGLSPMIITIGNCAVRRAIAERLQCSYGCAIHPSAIISPSVTIGEGTVVMHGAIIQADSAIGRHCIINTKASIDHECKIGDFVHIAPGCTVSGDVHIGSGTWLGAGATVIQGIRIGRDCFIGAGAVVVRDIPDNTLAYGVPAKKVKKKDNNHN